MDDLIYGIYRDGPTTITVAPASEEGYVTWSIDTDSLVYGVSSAEHVCSVLNARDAVWVDWLDDGSEDVSEDTRTLAELNID